jgi:hypothetical protein
MENTLYQDTFFSLTVASQIKKYIYLRLGNIPKNSDALRNGLNNILLIISQLQKDTLLNVMLIDLQNTKPFIPEDCRFIGEIFLPQLVKAGIFHLSIINPKSLFTQYSLEDIRDSYKSLDISAQSLDLKTFDSESEAQVYLINWTGALNTNFLKTI